MADQLRLCPECNRWVHVTKMHVGRRGCLDCEDAKNTLLRDLGILTPDLAYAESEEKIWRFAKESGTRVKRLI